MSGPALALRFANVSGGTTATQSFPQVVSGSSTAAPVTATWTQQSLGGYFQDEGTDSWPWSGSTYAMYNNTLPSSPTARELEVYSRGCAYPSGTSYCGGRGTITLTFSSAVTDPVLYVAGFGGDYGSVQTSGVLDIASATNGGTPTTVSFGSLFSNNNSNGSSTLQITPTRLQTSATRPGTECNSNSGGDDLNGRAGCGMVTLTGTMTQITFDVSVKLNSASAGTISSSANAYDTIRYYVALQDAQVPVAHPDEVTVGLGQQSLPLDLVANDTPLSGIPFVPSSVRFLGTGGFTLSNGTATQGYTTAVHDLTGTTYQIAADGRVTVTANGVIGPVTPLTYRVTDEAGNTTTSTLSVTIVTAPMQCVDTVYKQTLGAIQIIPTAEVTGSGTYTPTRYITYPTQAEATSNALGVAPNGTRFYMTGTWSGTEGGSVIWFDSTTGQWGHQAATGASTALAGAVNPVNGNYYYGTVDRGAPLYMVDHSTGAVSVVGLMPGSGTPGLNGDIAFTSTGDLLVVAGLGTVSALRMVTAADLAQGVSTQVLPSTTIPTSLTHVGVGIAFDEHGYLYTLSSGDGLRRIDPLSAQVLAGPRVISGGSYDMSGCGFPPTLTLRKDVTQRIDPSDQFQLSIASAWTTTQSATTTDSVNGVQAATVNTILVPGRTYTLAEAAAGTTTLDTYASSYACVDATTGNPLDSGAGTSFTFSRAQTAGLAVVCTFTNEPPPPELTTTKSLLEVNDEAATVDQEVAAGDELTYRIGVTNAGSTPGTVTLTETVPVNSAYTGAGWTCLPNAQAGSTCTTAVTVAALGSASADFEVTLVDPLPSGTLSIVNTVTATYDGQDVCAEDGCTVTTPTVATPVVTKDLVRFGTTVGEFDVEPGFTADPGVELIYEISVTNAGNPTTAPVTLTETVPVGTTYSGTGWTCTPDGSAGNVCTYDVPPPVAPGETVEFRVTVDDPLDPAVNEIVNTVTATYDGQEVCAEDGCTVTTPLSPAWTLTKVASLAGSPLTDLDTVRPGDVITYTVTATALRGTVTEIDLVDELGDVLDDATLVPESIALTVGGVSQTAPEVTGTAPDQQLLAEVATLTAPDSAVLTYQVTIDADAWTAVVGNVATGSANETPPVQCAAGGPVVFGPTPTGCFVTLHTPAYLLLQKLGQGINGETPMDGAAFAVFEDDGGAPGQEITDPGVEPGGESGEASGLFTIASLSAGTYWLRETQAPAGHNLLAQDVQFTVAIDYDADPVTTTVTIAPGTPQVTASVDAEGTWTIQVTDTTPFDLPLAGGPGTHRVTLTGLALLAGAALALLVRLRRPGHGEVRPTP
ncbi:SpaA isopeptide-forming pilin-related protein [Serinibacter salmoneus]|uniref:DUF7927 domain-containing protein n=1 Tax=Serinibacter salmoneus TaxID=556530 RepID=UPI001474DD47|nr:SpaA isopeptide-forming pilin-related protein [Serinibacter salmoneus]